MNPVTNKPIDPNIDRVLRKWQDPQNNMVLSRVIEDALLEDMKSNIQNLSNYPQSNDNNLKKQQSAKVNLQTSGISK